MKVGQIYVDMDGVLADFDAHHEAVFGVRPDKVADNVDWGAVRAHKGFYGAIPPMVDLPVLWAYLKPFRPVVLTGVPASVPEAPDNKKAWCRKHLGPDVPVICCRSRYKSQFCNRYDVLIDDWEKYRDLWIAKGGHWITHTSAQDTIRQIHLLGL